MLAASTTHVRETQPWGEGNPWALSYINHCSIHTTVTKGNTNDVRASDTTAVRVMPFDFVYEGTVMGVLYQLLL